MESLLPSWIEALSKRPERRTDKLLVEAQNMLQDKEAALEIASRHAESHPVLYQNILLTMNWMISVCAKHDGVCGNPE